MCTSNKRLTVLSKLEKFALYDPPDFDEDQRAEFLTFTERELQLIFSRSTPGTQIYCAVQLGYFKAKQLLFRLPWDQIDEKDILFISQNYFPSQTIDNFLSQNMSIITKAVLLPICLNIAHRASIPNYGERYRYGEAISSAFVESTVNEVISRRMAKKQQMRWTKKGAHLLLQVRVKTLNNELRKCFCKWFPNMKPQNEESFSVSAVTA